MPNPKPALLLIASLGLASCSGAPAIDLATLSAEPAADGLLAEWGEGLVRLDDAGLSVGVARDGEKLHVALATADPGLQQQIANLGLIVWFEGRGREERRYGIHFPRAEGEGGPPRGDRPADESERRLQLERRIAALPAEFLFVRGKGGSGRLMRCGGDSGVELSMRLQGPRLVYELEIPLAGSLTLVPLALEGDVLALGLQVPARDDRARGGRSGGAPGGGLGGRGGSPGGGGGTGGLPPMGFGKDRRQALDAWLKVRLD